MQDAFTRTMGLCIAGFVVVGYTDRESYLAVSPPETIVLKTPNLVSFWNFQEEGGKNRIDKSKNYFQLRQVGDPVERIKPDDGAPFGSYAADLKYPQRFELLRAEMGALNIHGKKAQVTVVAWLKGRKAWEHGKPARAHQAIAGVWREQDHKRQYCLFLNIKSNMKMLPQKSD